MHWGWFLAILVVHLIVLVALQLFYQIKINGYNIIVTSAVTIFLICTGAFLTAFGSARYDYSFLYFWVCSIITNCTGIAMAFMNKNHAWKFYIIDIALISLFLSLLYWKSATTIYGFFSVMCLSLLYLRCLFAQITMHKYLSDIRMRLWRKFFRPLCIFFYF